jgi:hypothetical protein
MEIDSGIIQRTLELYKPEARVLIHGQVEYPLLIGEFRLHPTFYTISPLQHAADIEIQLCLNQLAYAGLAQVIDSEAFSELAGVNFESVQREGCLVIESRKKFRRPIRTDRPIRGKITMGDFRNCPGLILGHATFDFENRSCIGDLTLALVRNVK